jgi:hypothetical protein
MFLSHLPFVNLSNNKEFNSIVINDYDSLNDDSVLKVNNKYAGYKIIQYNKDKLTSDTVKTYGLFRSVILTNDGKVIAFSPPKSVACDYFIDNYPSKISNIVAEEYVEGTMINVFWDTNISEWNISTRNTIGGNTRFFKSSECSKTFKDMFFEALNTNNLYLSHLNPIYCYSFVLQHPENRIVMPVKKPQVYLVALYTIDNTDKNNIKAYSIDMVDVKNFGWQNTTIKFPQIYEWNTYSELIEKYASMNTPYDVMGVVIYNKNTFERTKIRNPTYEQVKSLKGNQPKLQYQYICLRQKGKVVDFLQFYPEHKLECSKYRDMIHLFTSTLFQNYISCYIHKQMPLNEYPPQYKTHMFALHKMYIDNLREKKEFITNKIVIDYVNNLHPSLLMHSLNYNVKKQIIDAKNAICSELHV